MFGTGARSVSSAPQQQLSEVAKLCPFMAARGTDAETALKARAAPAVPPVTVCPFAHAQSKLDKVQPNKDMQPKKAENCPVAPAQTESQVASVQTQAPGGCLFHAAGPAGRPASAPRGVRGFATSPAVERAEELAPSFAELGTESFDHSGRTESFEPAGGAFFFSPSSPAAALFHRPPHVSSIFFSRLGWR
jgi:hypothetical protein